MREHQKSEDMFAGVGDAGLRETPQDALASAGRRAPIFLGTAGWSIPRIAKERFAPEGSHLERYARVLPAVEINSSFHRPHRTSTYERWAAAVPETFRFSVKAPKAVSHSDWREAASDIDAFFAEIAGLGSKLGAILIQLPPKRAFAPEEATPFLSEFRRRCACGLALEPRHATWFGPAPDELLRSLEIARVAADPPRAAAGDEPGGWSGLAYFRLHGSPDIYRSSYQGERLDRIAERLRAAASAGSETWCVFDNTTSYAATNDALALMNALAAETGEDRRSG